MQSRDSIFTTLVWWAEQSRWLLHIAESWRSLISTMPTYKTTSLMLPLSRALGLTQEPLNRSTRRSHLFVISIIQKYENRLSQPAHFVCLLIAPGLVTPNAQAQVVEQLEQAPASGTATLVSLDDQRAALHNFTESKFRLTKRRIVSFLWLNHNCSNLRPRFSWRRSRGIPISFHL